MYFYPILWWAKHLFAFAISVLLRMKVMAAMVSLTVHPAV